MHQNYKLSLLFQLVIKWQAELFKNLIHIDLQGHTAFLDQKVNRLLFPQCDGAPNVQRCLPALKFEL